jgi:hypothetical protein
MIKRTRRNKRKANRHDPKQDCLWRGGKSRRSRPKKKIKNEIFSALN